MSLFLSTVGALTCLVSGYVTTQNPAMAIIGATIGGALIALNSK